jgi:hypothetical protein
MSELTHTQRSLAITAYEDVQERTNNGSVVTSRHYYRSRPSHASHAVSGTGPTKDSPQVKKADDLGTISFMVLLNSVCLFFLLLVTFVKVLIG